MDVYRTIVTKRDERRYRNDALPEDLLQRIAQAGRMAGSAKNAQPLRLVLVRDAAQKKALAECANFAPHLPHAAAVAVLVLLPEAGQAAGQHAFFRGPFDAGRAAQNMMLAAWAEGVTSCPVTLHDQQAARRVLGLPADHLVANTVAFGYPAEGQDALRPRRPRLPLEDYVHWERW